MGYSIPPVNSIQYADTAQLDAFNRLRVSSPTAQLDAQFTYDLQPLLMEPITNGSGATVTHDTTNRNALMTFSSTPTGGKAYMQTYEWFRYQAGKSKECLISFNFIEAIANTLKFAGIGDGTNGFEVQQSGSTIQLVLYSGSTNGNQTVTQANWNIDGMNPSLNSKNPSGVTLDFTKTQLLVLDFQALYVGRARMGFNVGGITYYVHQFNHANLIAYPYIQNANLPIRAGMTCTGTVSTTMRFICCSVLSEGGVEDVSAYSQTAEGSATAGNNTFVHLLSIRPKTTFNSITNRIKFLYLDLDFSVTGANNIYWQLCIGQAISGTTTYTDVNSTYSAYEYNTAGTISGTPTLVIDSGYVAGAKSSGNAIIMSKYPITLDAAGAVRALGTLTLIVRGEGGTSACKGSLKWDEIR